MCYVFHNDRVYAVFRSEDDCDMWEHSLEYPRVCFNGYYNACLVQDLWGQ